MPLYDYLCTNCGKSCEILQKMNDAPAACPNCGKSQLQRQASAPHFQLKGTGWYATDFKNKPSHSKNETETKTESETATKSGENKPATEVTKPTSEKDT